MKAPLIYFAALIVAALIYGLVILIRNYVPKEPIWFNFLLMIPVVILGGFFGELVKLIFKDFKDELAQIRTKKKEGDSQ
jgi:hypothetical protein